MASTFSILRFVTSLSLAFLVSIASSADAQNWTTTKVPGGQKVDGYAWYRTWLLPNKYFFLKHERDLFRESVSITVRGLSGAHEVFVNGQKIGTGGSMPPKYSDGRDLNLRHKVPPGLIKQGQWNEIAFRVYHPGGEGGFSSEAPVIVTYFDECKLKGSWDYRIGEAPLKSKGALAEKPASTSFEEFKLATTALGEAPEFTHGPRLTPEESAKRFATADDLVMEQLLHEPQVAQPNHFSFDDRGRLWVAQYRQYPYPAGVKVLSRDQYYRSVFDKVPPAPPNHDKGRDVISIHEDTDGDGVFDKHKIFLDGLNMATSALPGDGGIWVMNPPCLLFYPDEDGDDVPDGNPVIHLEGFGLEDTHAVANSLTFGPDGWIYAAQGSSTSSRVVRPRLDDSDAEGVYFEGPMVWRYHPETREYEIFSEGGGNVFGLEFDNTGQLFSGNNGGDTRGWHYIQGATFGVEAANKGKYGPSPHPYNFGELRKMPSEQPIRRFSHIAAVVEGTALPESYHNHFFSIDPLHSNVIDSERFPLGSSFRTSDNGDVVKSEDEAFRPVFIGNAPDGSIYVADFYDHYIAHGQHYQSQIDPTSGRIYRIRGKNSELEKELDLSEMSTGELIACLSHPNKWHRRMAVRILGSTDDTQVVEQLSRVLESKDGQAALEALWAIHQIGKIEEVAELGLAHEFAPVREWTIRLLGDANAIPADHLSRVVELAKIDKNPRVRMQLACTARRLPSSQALPIAGSLMTRNEDADDPYVPLLIWWAIEEQIDNAAKEVLALLDDPNAWDEPIVFKELLPRLMRRFAMAGKRSGFLACAKLLDGAPAAKHSEQLLSGFNEAFRGRGMTGLPDELLTAMSRFGEVPLLMRMRQGEAEAMKEALEAVKNPKAEIGERISLINAMGELAQGSSQSVLLELALGKDSPEVRKTAFSALGKFDDETIADSVIAALPEAVAEVRPAAFALLLRRRASVEKLLAALEGGDVSTTLVTPDIADRLRLHGDEKIHESARQLFPATTVGNEAATEMIKDVEAALAEGLGDAYAGEKIYAARCASCHVLFFKGGEIGPNLTSYQRDNLGTMLISIVNPNAEIREGFEYQMLTTKDGRSIGGFLVDSDDKVAVLRGLDGQDITLKQEEIQELKPMGRSLMPDGLLNGLSNDEIRDLFAFLRISQPITR